MSTRQQYEQRLTRAWMDQPPEVEDEKSVPDGGRVRVSLSMMDAAQRAMPNPDVQRDLDALAADADRLAAIVDHYDHERSQAEAAEKAADGDRGQLEFERRLGEAWRAPA